MTRNPEWADFEIGTPNPNPKTFRSLFEPRLVPLKSLIVEIRFLVAKKLSLQTGDQVFQVLQLRRIDAVADLGSSDFSLDQPRLLQDLKVL